MIDIQIHFQVNKCKTLVCTVAVDSWVPIGAKASHATDITMFESGIYILYQKLYMPIMTY